MSLAAQTLSRRQWRRRHLIGLIALAILGLWGLSWLLAFYHLNKTLDKWIETTGKNGTTVQFEKRYTNGSPFAIHAHLDGLLLTSKSELSLQAKESVFYLTLWDWNEISGKLRKGVTGAILGAPFTANSIKFGLALPESKPKNHQGTALTLWLHPIEMSFTMEKALPFGNTLKEAMIDLRLMGSIPDFSNQDSLRAWNELGGVIEFDRLYLHWGEVIVTATGTVGLDPALQPEGAFSSRIEGIDTAIPALISQGAIDKRQESLLSSSLQVLARPSGILGQSAPIVPISLQDGGFYLGPVRLFSLPVFVWGASVPSVVLPQESP